MIPMASAVDAAQFKKTLGRFATGVAVLAADVGGRPVGMTVQSLVSLSLDPLLVSFAVARTSATWATLSTVDGLGISILSAQQSGMGLRFASSVSDRFAGIEHQRTPQYGHPVLAGATAWLEARVVSELPGGDHAIVVAEPVHVEVADQVDPLLYVGGSFGAFVAH